jgi:response regulator of citrate/malate metabolism
MSTKRILIAEDDMALKPLWEQFFGRFEFSVAIHWTVSCEEALKILEKADLDNVEFDLIISDIFLAGSGTGMDLLNSPLVKKGRSKKLLISAVPREQVVQEYPWATQDVEVVSKPFDGKLYESIITSLLHL